MKLSKVARIGSPFTKKNNKKIVGQLSNISRHRWRQSHKEVTRGCFSNDVWSGNVPWTNRCSVITRYNHRFHRETYGRSVAGCWCQPLLLAERETNKLRFADRRRQSRFLRHANNNLCCATICSPWSSERLNNFFRYGLHGKTSSAKSKCFKTNPSPYGLTRQRRKLLQHSSQTHPYKYPWVLSEWTDFIDPRFSKVNEFRPSYSTYSFFYFALASLSIF